VKKRNKGSNIKGGRGGLVLNKLEEKHEIKRCEWGKKFYKSGTGIAI